MPGDIEVAMLDSSLQVGGPVDDEVDCRGGSFARSDHEEALAVTSPRKFIGPPKRPERLGWAWSRSSRRNTITVAFPSMLVTRRPVNRAKSNDHGRQRTPGNAPRNL
jgi:hypothetical protein